MTDPVLVLLPDCCGGCRFWRPAYRSVALKAGCHIHGPTVMPFVGGDRSGVWPDTWANDWCGEHQARRPEVHDSRDGENAPWSADHSPDPCPGSCRSPCGSSQCRDQRRCIRMDQWATRHGMMPCELGTEPPEVTQARWDSYKTFRTGHP
jgi:hypothetical protein